MIKYPLIKPEVGEEEIEEIRKVFKSGWLTTGPEVEEFEREIARYVGAKYAVAVNSCTSALYLSAKCLGLKGEVIVPDFTFPATGNAVIMAGANIVLCDINNENYGLDYKLIDIDKFNTFSGIIVVHPFGYPLDLQSIIEKFKNTGCYIIEDAATALGAIRDGKYAGNIADIGCYSFHPRKILTTGEGGAIVLNDYELFEKLLILRDHGRDKKGNFVENSLNFRMPDVLAAIGLVQLRKIEKIIKERRRLANIYNEILNDILPKIRTIKEERNVRCTYQSYVIALPAHLGEFQKIIIESLKRSYNVETQIGTYSLHLEPAFSRFGRIGSLKNSEIARKTTITLPLYSGLEYEDIEYITVALKDTIYKIESNFNLQ